MIVKRVVKLRGRRAHHRASVQFVNNSQTWFWLSLSGLKGLLGRGLAGIGCWGRKLIEATRRYAGPELELCRVAESKVVDCRPATIVEDVGSMGWFESMGSRTAGKEAVRCPGLVEKWPGTETVQLRAHLGRSWFDGRREKAGVQTLVEDRTAEVVARLALLLHPLVRSETELPTGCWVE